MNVKIRIEQLFVNKSNDNHLGIHKYTIAFLVFSVNEIEFKVPKINWKEIEP